MADNSNSTSNNKSGCDTKIIKLKDANKISTDDALLSDNNAGLLEEQESSHLKQTLETSYMTPTELKSEAGMLSKMIDELNSESSLPTLSIASIRSSAAKTKASIDVKKEIINDEKVGEKVALSKLSIYTSTPIKPAKTLDIQPVEANSDENGKVASSDENKKEGNVIRLAPKVLTDEEKRKLRAKRFNIIVIERFENKKAITKTVTNRVQEETPMLENKSTPTFETLKKRAERFGENVSDVMKSLDQKERMLKRKLKFLESVTNLKEVEIKKRRAERFRAA